VTDSDAGSVAVGGKAWHLRRLQGLVDVPPFLVFSAEEAERADMCAAAVRSANLRAPFAVRSSADVEDSDQASFAGLFQTRLRVGEEDLADAILAVVNSGDSPHVHAYLDDALAACAANAPQVHVIVQEMIDAEVAGVCLTTLPERPGCAAVEAVWGLGDELVSGRADPDLYRYDRSSREATFDRPGNQVVRMLLLEGRTTVPASLRRARKLSESRVRAVAETALRLEEHFGYGAGADMEWAFSGERLWVLQVRPIARTS
jgi:pyruvate,water dikinase